MACLLLYGLGACKPLPVRALTVLSMRALFSTRLIGFHHGGNVLVIIHFLSLLLCLPSLLSLLPPSLLILSAQVSSLIFDAPLTYSSFPWQNITNRCPRSSPVALAWKDYCQMHFSGDPGFLTV